MVSEEEGKGELSITSERRVTDDFLGLGREKGALRLLRVSSRRKCAWC